MTKSSRGPKAGSGGGKTYGYQAPRESVMDTSIEDEKQAVVTAFDHFMDALAARAGSGDGGGTTGTSGSGGPVGGSGSTGQPPGGGGSGGSSAGARPSTGGATGTPYTGTPSTGTPSTGTPSTGTPSTGTPSKPGTATDGYEAHEMSIYSQREAYRADRARETARRARRKEVAEVPIAGGPPVQRSKHQPDSNRAPLTATKEFSPAFGSHGKSDRPTRERVSVPAAKRPETVPTDGTVAGLKPIDAYWGSFGTAVERAAVRARLDSEMLEAILGTDERVRINDTASYPYRCICSLLITASTGAQYVGTAWLVAPRLLLTAGHCVYMSDEGGWVREIEVIPGRDADQRPYGSAVARDFRSVTGWTQDGDSDYDYGAILLPGDARYGDQLGWFGYASRGDDYMRGITVNLSGYPGDGGPARVDGTQWFDSRMIQDVQDRQITYVADTYGGQSGAPVWEVTTDNNRYGVAIHTFGTSVHNGGTRITGDVFDNVVAWSGEVP